MNTQTAVLILAICVSLLVGAGSTFVLMHDADKLSLPPGIYGLPLSNLWSVVTDQTGVDNSTAILSQMTLITAPDGVVESLIFDFYGDEEGIHQWYHVGVNPKGAITWRSSKIDGVPPEGTHPLSLFTEIERIPYREWFGEKAGLAIDVDSQSGDLSYGASSNSDIFVMDTGELTPLKRVEFHTDEPFYEITICYRMEYESVMVSEEKTLSVAVPQNDSPCSIVFTIPDLEKAEVVEYR